MSRPPGDARLQQALAFVHSRESSYRGEKEQAAQPRHRALTDLAHVLLNSSEFIHIE